MAIPDEDSEVPDDLVASIQEFMAAATKDPIEDYAEIPDAIPDPPKEDENRVTSREAARTKELLTEYARRRSEALAVFEPLDIQNEFFSCLSNERIFLGGNRGGKTLTAAIEVARVMTGQDPYSKQPKRDGRAILVGKDLNHCGKVMARKLFKSDQFKVIRDPVTGIMRAFRPWAKWDQENAHLRRPAPPLIPPRMIKYISWENKKEGIIKSFELKNGWEGTFYSSEGDAPQGQEANLVWFDEEIAGALWYMECSARLVDRDGIFIWSATPQSGTIELYDLYQRSLGEGEEKDDNIAAFQISMMDNPHLSEKARNKLLNKIQDEGEYEVRVDGKFALHGIKIYPEFQPRGAHECDITVDQITPAWTRFVTVDPGVQVCGVLFAAVPPPQTPGFVSGQYVIYDELYIRRCDAKMFGKEMARKLQGVSVYKWAIDNQMGRQTLPTGKTYAQHYQDALKENKLESDYSGSKFMIASPDISGGIEEVRQGLRYSNHGFPSILIAKGTCPNLCKEASRYVYQKKPSGEITDKPATRKFHLMDCLRYLAMLGPKYKRIAKKRTIGPGTALGILNAKKERAKLRERAEGGNYTSLG